MRPTTTDSITRARAAFSGGRGYLAACTTGLPPIAAREAVVADIDAAARGDVDIAGYSAAVESSRASFATLVGAAPDRVAIGSQVSVLTALVADGVPDGGEVLVPEGEFSSVARPFLHAGRGLRIRPVALESLADEIGAQTSLVAFSLVQSASGTVADCDAILEAARRHRTRTYCDATQAAGWMPVDAARFDAVACHAYKWLCSPRGVAFLVVSEEFQRHLIPRYAGWYAGADPWLSCYGHEFPLATDARALDVSPAWQAFVGAAPALELFVSLDMTEVFAHVTELAARFREGRGLRHPALEGAIVTWADPDASDLAALTAAGITASGRSGRARVGFHVFNDEADVEIALAALVR